MVRYSLPSTVTIAVHIFNGDNTDKRRRAETFPNLLNSSHAPEHLSWRNGFFLLRKNRKKPLRQLIYEHLSEESGELFWVRVLTCSRIHVPYHSYFHKSNGHWPRWHVSPLSHIRCPLKKAIFGIHCLRFASSKSMALMRSGDTGNDERRTPSPPLEPICSDRFWNCNWSRNWLLITISITTAMDPNPDRITVILTQKLCCSKWKSSLATAHRPAGFRRPFRGPCAGSRWGCRSWCGRSWPWSGCCASSAPPRPHRTGSTCRSEKNNMFYLTIQNTTWWFYRQSLIEVSS